MKAGVVFPHDIIKAAHIDDNAATIQWSQLPLVSILGDALVLCDVSGSMHQMISRNLSCLDVCVAMGLYLSERLEGPFKDQILTFTKKPTWHAVSGSTLMARVHNLESAEWGMNTNIQAAYDAILERAKMADPGFNMPKCLIVLSDMEFDAAGPRLNHTLLERKFKAAGFAVPKMVYWNLRGRPGNVPSSKDKNCILISGYSPVIMSSLMDADFDGFTPLRLMHKAVDKSRYSIPGLC